VAQLALEDGGSPTWTFLTTDHLGTPLRATDMTGAETWSGPFEPFGEDPFKGTPDGALANDVLLRFPGQWEDPIWQEATEGVPLYHNLHRWLEYGTGRYTRPDPLPTELPNELSPFLYVYSNPLLASDALGLSPYFPCSDIPKPPTPCNCDADKLRARAEGQRGLRDEYCKLKNSSERPPGVPAPGKDEDLALGVLDPELGPMYRKQGDPCLEWCTCAHERQHDRDTDDPRFRKLILDGIPDQQIVNWLECRAYNTSFFCAQGFARGGIR
jgi:RHS repeat-associated protein